MSQLTTDLATLLGVFDNGSVALRFRYLGWLVRYYRLFKVGLYSIPVLFGRTIGFRLWRLMTEVEEADEKAQEEWTRRAQGEGDEHLVIAVWLTRKILKARRKASKNSKAKLTLKDRLLITFLGLALIFASAHQVSRHLSFVARQLAHADPFDFLFCLLLRLPWLGPGPSRSLLNIQR